MCLIGTSAPSAASVAAVVAQLLMTSEVTATECDVRRALGNIPLFDLDALPPATAEQRIFSCGSNCPQVSYLRMVQGIPASLCNASCVANEQAWAYATLSQPANTTRKCDATCLANHNSFMERIQLPVLPMTTMRHRSLLQASQTCVVAQPCPPAICNRAGAPETFCSGCDCTLTYTIAVSVLAGSAGSVPAKCGSAPSGTTFIG